MSSNAISPNHREILSARSTVTGKQEYLKSTNGALTTTGGGGGGSATFVTNNVYHAQVTMTGSAIQLAPNTLSQGITIEALSTNSLSVYVGASGVTTSTGIEIPAGAAMSFPASNSNLLYVIGTTSDKISWIAG